MENTLNQARFTADGIANLIQMTKAVIEGKTKAERDEAISLHMDFKTYLKQNIDLR